MNDMPRAIEVVELIVLTKSSGSAAPGKLQSAKGKKAAFQVASPAVAGLPVGPVLFALSPRPKHPMQIEGHCLPTIAGNLFYGKL